MPHLLFRLGEEAFAINAEDLAAVLPLPDLATLAQAPPHFAGLLRYRGQLVPVIDLRQLHDGAPCRRVISTRILLVSTTEGGHLGLLVEQAMEMLDLAAPQSLAPELFGGGRDWLAPTVYETPQGLVQGIDWRMLLTPELQTLVGQAAE